MPQEKKKSENNRKIVIVVRRKQGRNMFVIFSFLSFKSLTGRCGITIYSSYGLGISKKLLSVWKPKTGESGGLAAMLNCQKST